MERVQNRLGGATHLPFKRCSCLGQIVDALNIDADTKCGIGVDNHLIRKDVLQIRKKTKGQAHDLPRGGGILGYIVIQQRFDDTERPGRRKSLGRVERKGFEVLCQKERRQGYIKLRVWLYPCRQCFPKLGQAYPRIGMTSPGGKDAGLYGRYRTASTSRFSGE